MAPSTTCSTHLPCLASLQTKASGLQTTPWSLIPRILQLKCPLPQEAFSDSLCYLSLPCSQKTQLMSLLWSLFQSHRWHTAQHTVTLKVGRVDERMSEQKNVTSFHLFRTRCVSGIMLTFYSIAPYGKTQTKVLANPKQASFH